MLAQLLAKSKPAASGELPDPLGEFSGPQRGLLGGSPQLMAPQGQTGQQPGGSDQSMQSMAGIASAILPLVLALI